MAKIIQNIFFLVAVMAVILGSALWLTITVQNVYGSVSVTDEYIATSTAANAVYGATITGDTLIKTGQGTLGSIVVLGANTGIVNVYDATTTNVNLRTGQTPTSTILIASLPASLAAGTYTFDVWFKQGLLFDLVSGSMPTTTVTVR